MAGPFKALVASARQLTLLGRRPVSNQSGPDGPTAKDMLFQRTDPVVDGEECMHDCESCSAQYPRGFQIEEDDELYGHVKAWSVHVLVATGKTDWKKNVGDEDGSVMQAIEKAGPRAADGGRVMLSACNMPVPMSDGSGGDYSLPTSVLVLPSFTIIENVTPEAVPHELCQLIATATTTTSPLVTSSHLTARSASMMGEVTQSDSSPPNLSLPPASLAQRACPHSVLLLLCSQRTRDARCGQSAPILRRELERHLRPLGLQRDPGDERPGGVGIVFVSHVGGHKYSANMIVYRRRNPFGLDDLAMASSSPESDNVNGDGAKHPAAAVDVSAAQCIWLARIRPEDCENLVRYTVLRGKVVKPETQLRGGFDRSQGLMSW